MGLIVVLLLLAGGLFSIMHFYGNEVKQSLLDKLNKGMKIEISVAEIQLDLFTNFPRASLRFKQVSSKEKMASIGNGLLKAGEIALLFNIVDIYHGNYKIEKIKLQDAFLNLLVKADGNVNYKIFNKQSSSENNISIDLKQVNFKNVVVSYIHTPSQQEYLFRIDEGGLQGVVSSHLQQFHFKGSVYSTHIKSGKNTFLKNRLLALETEIEIDNKHQTIYFKKGNIKTEGLQLDVTGNVVTNKATNTLSLGIRIERSPLKSLVKLIPHDYLEPVNEFSLDGDVTLSANISGNFTGNTIPRFEVEFILEDGLFSHKKNDLTLSEVKFNGKFTNGKYTAKKSYYLLVKDVYAIFDGGKLEGAIEISNFLKPQIHVQVLSAIQLHAISSLLSIEKLDQISGGMEVNLEFRNTLKNFRKFTIHDFISSQTTGSLRLSAMNFRIKGSPRDFHDFNGVFRFNNKDLKIEQFSGYISGNDFNMRGYFRNILAYAFLPDESIFIDTDFRSEKFNLDKILETGKDKTSENARLRFSDRVNFNLNIQIDTFTFRKFSSTHNVGELIQRNRILYVKNTRFNSMDGKVTIDGSMNGQDDQIYYLNCNADFKEVNIRKLFEDFGDFGQQNLTSDHLKGTVDARVEYASTLTPYLFVDQKSVYTLADVQIYNGELIRYRPLKKLSKYVREGEFDHVNFSALKNKIKIENEVIYIPQMDIESSSMNLNLYGNHTFNNDIDYHVQLLLSEIITRKAAIEEDLGDDFAEDDGLGRTRLFLSMTGSADDPVVKYDTREVRNKISVDLKKEKKELKKVFQEEFGLDVSNKNSGSDSLINYSDGQKSFDIEWEDNKDTGSKGYPDNRKTVPEKETSDQQDFIILWDEEKDTINRNFRKQ